MAPAHGTCKSLTRGKAKIGGRAMRNPNPIVRKLLHLIVVKHTAMGKPDVWPLPLDAPVEHTTLAQHSCGMQRHVMTGCTDKCQV